MLRIVTVTSNRAQLDGEKVLPAEEPAPAKQKKAQTLSAEETAEKEAKKKAEEHESWWSHARHAMGADVEETGSELATKPKRM